MTVNVTNDGGGRYTVICPPEMGWAARVDLAEAMQAAMDGEDAVAPLSGVVVDLGAVEHINSSGIGAIFALRKLAVQSGAGVVVCRPRPMVARVLTVVNLPVLIPVVHELEAAHRLLDQPAPAVHPMQES